MSLPISDYAIVGDTHTTALISRDGSVDWLCWPRHDSPALFIRLLDDESGGACQVSFDGGSTASRRYLADTNVLETTFELSDGRATLTDFMPIFPPNMEPIEGPDGDAESRLVRILACDHGVVEGRFTVRPTFDYARQPCTPQLQDDGSVLFETGETRLRATSCNAATLDGDTATVAFRLVAGERIQLVLTHGEDGAAPPLEGIDGALKRLHDTTRYWQGWISRCRYDGEHQEAVRRSALFLKLMTYSPTGAIIAAPTLGLPEAVPGNRNFDYRYAWLRDASFTVTAFVNLGYYREAEEYLRFLRGVDKSHGRHLKLMYGIDGRVPDEQELPHLAGWRRVGPVTLGNAAADQTQHDIYGELLLALEDYLEAKDFDGPEALMEGAAELVCNLAERAIEARDEPDQGIWEPRTPPLHYLHSKGLIWVALDRAVRLGGRLGIEQAQLDRWRWVAGEVREDYLQKGWNEAKGAYTQAYGADALDAAVLRIALFDALPLDDGRLQRTLDAVQRELGDGDLIYRYRTEDGMEGQEGSFTACSFWYAACLSLVGHGDEARARFTRILSHANDVGLMAEEIDPATREQRGNFPQGFTHMAIINHSVRISQNEEKFRQAMAAQTRAAS